MIKKIFTIMMCAVLAISFVPTTAKAAVTTEDYDTMDETNEQRREAGSTMATNITEKTDANGKKYYSGLTIAPFNYYDIGGGSKSDLNDTLLYNVVKDDLLKDWTEVANGCFIDAKDSASMRYDFEKKFNHTNDLNCFGDIRPFLKNENLKEYGSQSRDSLHASGLKTVNNLNEVRVAAAKDISHWIDHKALSYEGILEQGPKGDDGDRHALKEMMEIGDAQKKSGNNSPVFYNFVTSISEIGCKFSNRYAYNTYGIAFYDFQPRVIMADNLKYKSATDGCETLEEAKEKADKGQLPGFTYVPVDKKPIADVVTNASADPITMNMSTTTTHTATLTNTMSHTNSLNFGTKIGASSSMSKTIPFLGSASVNRNVELNFGSTISDSTSESNTVTNSNTVTTGITGVLPGHTAVDTTTSGCDTTITEEYDAPVALSYKVCIFALTGTVYADTAALCDFGSYDHGYFVNIVGADTKNGVSATENLYKRVNENPKSHRKDSATGAPVIKWTDTKWSNDDGVDWTTSYLTSGRGKTALDKVSCNMPMLSCGCKYEVQYEATEQKFGAIHPLYRAEKFVEETGEGKYTLKDGEELNITDQIKIGCLDRYGVPYYGFNQADGEWHICDEKGNPTETDVITISPDGVDKQIITGNHAGTTYLRWNLKEDVTLRSMESGVVTYEDNLKSPIIQINVDGKTFDGTLNVKGEFTGHAGETGLNLNQMYTVTAYDNTGKKVNVPFVWEAQELPEDGIDVADNGNIFLTQDGTYHIRAVVKNAGSMVYSDWITITTDAPANAEN